MLLSSKIHFNQLNYRQTLQKKKKLCLAAWLGLAHTERRTTWLMPALMYGAGLTWDPSTVVWRHWEGTSSLKNKRHLTSLLSISISIHHLYVEGVDPIVRWKAHVQMLTHTGAMSCVCMCVFLVTDGG